MDISQYELEIKRHALVRALQRGIDPDLLENLLRKGKIKRYGNDGIKFISKGSKRTITCVGQVIGTKIVIFTIEKGN